MTDQTPQPWNEHELGCNVLVPGKSCDCGAMTDQTPKPDARYGPFGDAPTLQQSLIRERDRYKAEAIALRAEVERLREKLSRVADWIRYAANSPGGIVAEVEEILAGREKEESR